jgi:hypothetical protein
LDWKHAELRPSDDLAGELEVYFVRGCLGHSQGLLLSVRMRFALPPNSFNDRVEFLHCSVAIRSTKWSMPGMASFYDLAGRGAAIGSPGWSGSCF